MITFAKGINDSGHDAQVICLQPNLSKSHDFLYEGSYEGVLYKYLHKKVHPSSSKIGRWIDRVKAKIVLGLFLYKNKEESTVIYFGRTSYLIPYLALFCKWFRIPKLIEICEFPFSTNSLNSYSIKELKHIVSQYRLFDGYIFESANYESYYKKNIINSDAKSLVMPTTMYYDDILEAERGGKGNYFAYCGSIFSEDKDGLIFILDAYSKLSSEIKSKFKLYFIGRISNDSYFNLLTSKAYDLGIISNVFFTGEICRADFISYLVNATVLLVAKPPGSFHEGYSSKVVEYLFAKRPIVMTATDIFADLLENNKHVFFANEYTADSFADKIIYVLNESEKVNEITTNGFELAMQMFDYRKLSFSLVNFLKELQHGCS